MAVAELTTAPTESSDPSPGSARRTAADRWYLALLVALPMAAAAGVYANALHNPFVWDDFRTAADNQMIRRLDDVRRVVLQDRSRPLVNLSYALDNAIWGPQRFAYHFGSVVLHVLNTLLLFVLVRRLVADWQSWQPPGSPRPPTEIVAAATVWPFAVHPMMTEAVGYISGRTDVLCAVFLLLACLALRRWAGGASRVWLTSGIVLWLGALASKETGLVAPLLLLAWRATIADPRDGALQIRLFRAACVLLAIAVALGGLRLALLLLVENPGALRIHWWHLLVEADVLRRHIQLLILPADQSVMHPVVAITSWSQARAAAAAAFAVLLAALVWYLRRRNGLLAFGLLWFVIAMLPPVLLVVLDLAHPMAEHRAYLANAGLFLCLGSGVGWLLVRPGTTASARRVLLILLGLGTVTLGAMTVVRNEIWGDPRVLWLDAVRKAPDIWLPHLLLGESLHAAGQREAAVGAYAEARRLRPDYPDISLKLGLCLLELGRRDQAREVFVDLRERSPASPIGPHGLGTLALLDGDREQARGHFLEALRRDPHNPAALESLALLDREDRPDGDPARR